HGLEDLFDRFLGRSLPVGVLDPQHETSAVVAREQIVEQRRPYAPEVERTGRAGREASAHRGHGRAANRAQVERSTSRSEPTYTNWSVESASDASARERVEPGWGEGNGT